MLAGALCELSYLHKKHNIDLNLVYKAYALAEKAHKGIVRKFEKKPFIDRHRVNPVTGNGWG